MSGLDELERAASAGASPHRPEDRFAHLFHHRPFSILVATYPEGRIATRPT